MGDLLPFGNGEISQTRRGIKKELLKLDGLAEFSDRTADYVVHLNARRRLRVQAAPEVEPILNELLINFALDAQMLQKRLLREF